MATLFEKLDACCYLCSSFALGCATRETYSNKMLSHRICPQPTHTTERNSYPHNWGWWQFSGLWLQRSSLWVHAWEKQTKITHKTSPLSLNAENTVTSVQKWTSLSRRWEQRFRNIYDQRCLCWVLVLWPKLIFQKPAEKKKSSASSLKGYSVRCKGVLGVVRVGLGPGQRDVSVFLLHTDWFGVHVHACMWVGVCALWKLSMKGCSTFPLLKWEVQKLIRLHSSNNVVSLYCIMTLLNIKFSSEGGFKELQIFTRWMELTAAVAEIAKSVCLH